MEKYWKFSGKIWNFPDNFSASHHYRPGSRDQYHPVDRSPLRFFKTSTAHSVITSVAWFTCNDVQNTLAEDTLLNTEDLVRSAWIYLCSVQSRHIYWIRLLVL